MSTDNIRNPIHTSDSPPITIVLSLILLVCFFIGFFSLYFCRCFMQDLLHTLRIRNTSVATPVPTGSSPGLDPKIMETFPCFVYSSVKEYRKEKYGLECAICLVEFTNEDMLRLLPSCCHVFHQECIDFWLINHTTCPVCRQCLNNIALSCHNPNDLESPGDTYRIIIKNENESGDGYGCEHDERPPPTNADNIDYIFRSKSTGHSIVREEDRYTLRLPEDVKGNIVGQHNVSKSCTNFGDRSIDNFTKAGFGEVSYDGGINKK